MKMTAFEDYTGDSEAVIATHGTPNYTKLFSHFLPLHHPGVIKSDRKIMADACLLGSDKTNFHAKTNCIASVIGVAWRMSCNGD